MNEAVLKLISAEIAETQNLLSIIIERQTRLLHMVQLLDTPPLPIEGEPAAEPAAPVSDSAAAAADRAQVRELAPATADAAAAASQCTWLNALCTCGHSREMHAGADASRGCCCDGCRCQTFVPAGAAVADAAMCGGPGGTPFISKWRRIRGSGPLAEAGDFASEPAGDQPAMDRP